MNIVHTLNNGQLKTLLVCSFRYALGRRTYITSDISGMLIHYKDALDKFAKDQIISDIDHAILHNLAGNQCDQEVWLKLKHALGGPK